MAQAAQGFSHSLEYVPGTLSALPGASRLNRTAQSVLPPNHLEDNSMQQSRGNLARTDRGDSTPNCSDQDADVIFVSEWARKYSAKEGASLTGMTPKGFQKVQAGDNAISYKKITQWMKRDEDFAAAYFVHVGLIKPGEGEFVGAFTKAINAAARMKGGA